MEQQRDVTSTYYTVSQYVLKMFSFFVRIQYNTYIYIF